MTTLTRSILLISLFFFTISGSNIEQAISATEGGLIYDSSTWQFPKVRSESSEEFYTLYWNATSNTLHFARWDGTTWINFTELNSTVLAGASVPGNRTLLSIGREYRASFDFDSQGNLHTLFTAGTDKISSNQDIIHGVYDGDWSFSLAADTSNAPLSLKMVIDNNDVIHITYVEDGVNSGQNHLLMYNSNASGIWQTPLVIIETTNRSDDELHDIHLVASENSVITILYQREDAQNGHLDSYYLTDSTTSFSTQTKLLDGATDQAQYRVSGLVADSTNFLHYVYSDLTNSKAHYSTNSSGSWVAEQLISSTNPITHAEDISISAVTSNILVKSNNGHFFMSGGTGSWTEGELLTVLGDVRDRVAFLPNPMKFMIVSEDKTNFNSYFVGTPNDTDGKIEADTAIIEPIALHTSANSVAPLDILDFKITDQGTTDGLPLIVKNIDLTLSGTASAHFSKLRFNLSGCKSIAGIAPVNNTLSFSNISLTVANGSSVSCVVQAYWNDTTGVRDDQNVALGFDSTTDVVVSGANTTLETIATTITTGDMKTDVVATKLAFSSQPAGSISGIALVTPPVIIATDGGGNTDTDFNGVVSLSSSVGSLTQSMVTASSGIATFSNLTYWATADKQVFTLTANEAGTLTQVTSQSVTSEVIATKLSFSTQPAGSISGAALVTQPIVEALDDNSIRDIDFTETVTLTETSSGQITGSTAQAVAGTATFANLIYSASADREEFILKANDEDTTQPNLPTVNSDAVVSDVMATQLVFTRQPSPLSIINGQERNFIVDPIVAAQDADNITDTDFNDTVSLGSTGSGAAIFHNNIITAVAGVATFMDLRLSYTTNTLPETIAIRADDLNNGSNIEGDLPARSSAILTIGVLPAPPSVPDLSSSSDSGSSDSDNITNITTPTFTGTAPIGTTITLASSISGDIGSAGANSSGVWSITSNTILTHNTQSISATATSVLGTSPPSSALQVIIDTQAPNTPGAPDLADISDSGASSTDNITKIVTPVITGQTEQNASIELLSDSNGDIGTAVADGSGGWTITSTTLIAGNQLISYIARDIAGNDSSSSSQLSLTVDILAPLAPLSLDLAAASDSGVSDSDNRTNISSPTLSGSAEASSSIILYSTTDGQIGSTITNNSGNWSSIAATLSAATHQIHAIATDVAGNTSNSSTILTVLVDTAAPVINNLPLGITVQVAQKGDTSAVVSWPEPTATDDTDGVVITAQSAGPANSSVFPRGNTTVSYVASDNQGNTTTESFSVTVSPYSFPWWLVTPGLVSPNKVIKKEPLTD